MTSIILLIGTIERDQLRGHYLRNKENFLIYFFDYSNLDKI